MFGSQTAQGFSLLIEFMKSLSLTQNALWNIGSTICNFILLFVGTPIIVRSLGAEQYGIYLLLGMLSGVLAISGMGLGEANIKYIAQYYSKEDYQSVNQTFSAVFFSYLFLGGIITLVFCFCPHVLSTLLNFPRNDSITSLIRIAVLLFFINLVGGPIGSIPSALQRYDITAVVDFLYNAVRVLAVICVVKLGYGLTQIMNIVLLLAAIFFFIKAIIGWRLIPTLRLTIPAFATIKEVFSYGFFLFSSELVGLVWQYADPFILTRFLSPCSVAFFSVPMQLIGKFTGVIAAGTNVLLPKVSAEASKSDRISDSLQFLFLQGTQVGLLCSILIFVPMTLLLPTFLRLWISPDFAKQAGFVGMILAGSYIIRGAFLTYTPFLKGIGKTKILFCVTLFSSLLILCCDLILIPIFGVSGVGYSYILSATVGVVAILYCAGNILKINLGSFLKSLFVPYFTSLVIVGVGGWIRSIHLVSIDGWLPFICWAVIIEIITFISLYLSNKIFRYDFYFSFIKKHQNN